jgi:hypothetical protein
VSLLGLLYPSLQDFEKGTGDEIDVLEDSAR